MIQSGADLKGDWERIHERDCPLLLEEREPPLTNDVVASLLAEAPFAVLAEGDVDALAPQLNDLPDCLIADIEALAARFAALTGKRAVRVRLEAITTNACKKVHADYTDVRLITTYAGLGTDYAPDGDRDGLLARMPTGWVGLFKGCLFGEGHQPCLHRSPPIEGSGEARLILVIDTPLRAAPAANPN